MASGQGSASFDQATNQPPPPYAPQSQEQQHVHGFVKQNPQGFIQTQQPAPGYVNPGQNVPLQGGFSDISRGYGYQQPPVQQNSTSNTVVVCQNQASPTFVINPAPYSYLLPAVLSCLFCCWLVGIGAIVAAIISRGQSDDMNYDEARRSANIAKILTIISFVLGCVMYVIIVILFSVGSNSTNVG